MLRKKLGEERARKVMAAIQKDEDNFGFIKITIDELKELEALYIPHQMSYRSDVFSFRAGAWVVMIIDHNYYIEIWLINPYDSTDSTNVAFAE